MHVCMNAILVLISCLFSAGDVEEEPDLGQHLRVMADGSDIQEVSVNWLPY